jgi:hypothetical protein
MKTSLGRRVGILGGSLCLATVGLVAAGTTSVLEAAPAAAVVPTSACPAPVIVGTTATVTCPYIAPNGDVPNPVQSWTPPVGVTSETVTAYGAQGGSSDGGGTGGGGGVAVAPMTVAFGSTLDIIVGGLGSSGAGANTGAAGGYNGGGIGGAGNGAGGGGASTVSDGVSNLLIAGGGGGAGGTSCGVSGAADGGFGGGTNGGGGSAVCEAANAGVGGTQAAGGAAGGTPPGAGGSTGGSPGQGGNGGFSPNTPAAPVANGAVPTCEGPCIGGGGGGGGLFGGGGGGAVGILFSSPSGAPVVATGAGGGGGGSGLIPAGGSFGACDGPCTGNGMVVITYTPIGTNPTTTSVASSENPSLVGDTVTYTATVTTPITDTVPPHTAASGGATPHGLVGIPTGSVEFFDGETPIPGCTAQPLSGGAPDTATCAVTYNTLDGSPHPITARYLGDPVFAQSTSAVLSQVVFAPGGPHLPTTITITCTPNPSVGGETVTCTATVTFPPSGAGTHNGTVTFFDNGVPIPGCINLPIGGSPPYTVTCSVSFPTPTSSVRPVSAHATTTSAQHVITASYSGNGVFSKSSAPAVIQNVVPPGQLVPFESGYRMVASDGGVFSFGGLQSFGSMGGQHLNKPVVGMATPTWPATGWWPRTGGSSASATLASSARPARCASINPSWGWPPLLTAVATGWWPPTGASSPSVMPASSAPPGR